MTIPPLRPYQAAAVASVTPDITRGQIIAATGTGKTVIQAALIAPTEGHCLVLAPTRILVEQTVRRFGEYMPHRPLFAVFSGDDITDGETEAHASTDPLDVKQFLADNPDGILVSTYQSSPKVAAAGADFALAVFDEAHVTAVQDDSDGSHFTLALSDDGILIRRRLFFTATPRRWTESKSGRLTASVSMDDTDIYGERLFTYTVTEGISDRYLSGFTILAGAVTDTEIANLIADNPTLGEVDGVQVSAEMLAAVVFTVRASQRHGLHRVLTFHSTTTAAHTAAELLRRVGQHLGVEGMWARDVNYRHKQDWRDEATERLNGSHDTGLTVVANQRIYTLGVDVPALQALTFFDPKQGEIDIGQSIGRALRRAPGKDHAYVLVPVFVRDGDDPDAALDASRFGRMTAIAAALRDLGVVLEQVQRATPAPAGLDDEVDLPSGEEVTDQGDDPEHLDDEEIIGQTPGGEVRIVVSTPRDWLGDKASQFAPAIRSKVARAGVFGSTAVDHEEVARIARTVDGYRGTKARAIAETMNCSQWTAATRLRRAEKMGLDIGPVRAWSRNPDIDYAEVARIAAEVDGTLKRKARHVAQRTGISPDNARARVVKALRHLDLDVGRLVVGLAPVDYPAVAEVARQVPGTQAAKARHVADVMGCNLSAAKERVKKCINLGLDIGEAEPNPHEPRTFAVTDEEILQHAREVPGTLLAKARHITQSVGPEGSVSGIYSRLLRLVKQGNDPGVALTLAQVRHNQLVEAAKVARSVSPATSAQKAAAVATQCGVTQSAALGRITRARKRGLDIGESTDFVDYDQVAAIARSVPTPSLRRKGEAVAEATGRSLDSAYSVTYEAHRRGYDLGPIESKQHLTLDEVAAIARQTPGDTRAKAQAVADRAGVTLGHARTRVHQARKRGHDIGPLS